MWKQWSQNNSDDSSGQQILNQTAIAENLYSSHRIVEAELSIKEIFNNLMENNQKGA